MKERHWDSLVTSLRHGQCVLILGPEIAAIGPEIAATPGSTNSTSWTEALIQHLSKELSEEINVRSRGQTLAAVSQQYEDQEGFGPNALRAAVGKFLRSGAYTPSEAHTIISSLPFSLIIMTS